MVAETGIAVEYEVGVEELEVAVGVEGYLESLFSTLGLFEARSRTALIRKRYS